MYIIVYTDISCFLCPRWTQEELKKFIAMLQNPEFDYKDIDPDLHERMDKTVQDGRIKCFNMRESDADGDQDLNLWAGELEHVVHEIMDDPIFKGNQNFKFESDLNWIWTRPESWAGRPMLWWQANAVVAYQIGQLRYVLYMYIHDMYMVLSIRYL